MHHPHVLPGTRRGRSAGSSSRPRGPDRRAVRRRSAVRRPRRGPPRRTPRPSPGAAAEISAPVSASGSKGPPRRICRARRTTSSTKASWRESSTISRAPAEQTWPECRNTAVRAKSTAVSKSASAKTTLGFLPPSSSATFFTVAAAVAMIRLPVSSPPVKETMSTRGSSESGAPDLGSGAQDEVGGAGREPGLLQCPHQQDRGGGGELAGLEDDRVAGEEGRGDLPTGLQQRVVPGSDEPADPDRLVDDPADGVVAAGVDHPAGVGAAEPAVVAEAGDDVGDVVLALHQPLAGVQRLGAGELLGVALDEVGGAQQQRSALPLGGVRPGSLVEGARGPRRSPPRCRDVSLPNGRGERAVSGTADLPAPSGHRIPPFPIHIQVCHAPSPSS